MFPQGEIVAHSLHISAFKKHSINGNVQLDKFITKVKVTCARFSDEVSTWSSVLQIRNVLIFKIHGAQRGDYAQNEDRFRRITDHHAFTALSLNCLKDNKNP